MERLQPEGAALSGGITAPKFAVSAPEAAFSATVSERIGAFAMYPLAYIYILMYDKLMSDTSDPLARVLLAAFTLGFFALTEYLHRDTPRQRESYIWLGCAAVVLGALLLGRGRAWEPGSPYLFLHIFAVWWALSRSGTLLEGESGRLLPLDALDGFVVFPFKSFFLRIRAAGFALSQLRGKKKAPSEEKGSLGWTVLISAAALGMFALSAFLLSRADNGFSALLGSFADLFRFDWDMEGVYDFFLRFAFSLPVGAYLFGLLAGTRREDKSFLRRRVEGVDETLAMLRGVPERVWFALLALFCLLYAVFFAVQGRYLFGAFTRTLPEGFIVSEYARRGFFELCGVTAVNFAVLWLVTRSARANVRENRPLLFLCLVLLAESFLLSVVALSKLALYIDCFGFTPRRLESMWLVCVLSFGCLCAAWSLRKKTKTFRVWMVFGAVTLSVLCLY